MKFRKMAEITAPKLSETFRVLQLPARNEIEDRLLDRIAIAALRDIGVLSMPKNRLNE